MGIQTIVVDFMGYSPGIDNKISNVKLKIGSTAIFAPRFNQKTRIDLGAMIEAIPFYRLKFAHDISLHINFFKELKHDE